MFTGEFYVMADKLGREMDALTMRYPELLNLQPMVGITWQDMLESTITTVPAKLALGAMNDALARSTNRLPEARTYISRAAGKTLVAGDEDDI